MLMTLQMLNPLLNLGSERLEWNYIFTSSHRKQTNTDKAL